MIGVGAGVEFVAASSVCVACSMFPLSEESDGTVAVLSSMGCVEFEIWGID